MNSEIIIDNFAGGGGASTGIALALGRSVDVAINHDPEAIAMHTANHPDTEHHCESVWDIDPRTVKLGRPIGLLWLSPDCKHFSKAKGGKPVEKKIRGLAWVALRWAAIRQPRVIMLENVEEFVTWGPLVEGPDGRMRPCPKRKGREFNAFRNALRRQGYEVEHRELRACDYGAPTIRKRLFLIARRDGMPIVWPAPTHGDPKSEAVKAGMLKPWRTAAECIDWSLSCPSIFERARPLAEATCRRIAKGIMRYVVNAAEPFVVPLTHHGAARFYGMEDPLPTVTAAHRGELAMVTPFLSTYYGANCPGGDRVADIDEPLRTQSTENRFALVAPILTEHANASSPRCMPADEPLRTICAQTKGGHHALVSAFLAKHYTGVVGADLRDPAPTVTSVDHNSLVTSNLIKLRGGGNIGQGTNEPLRTVSAGGTHFAEVRAFLIKYYGTDQDPRLDDPLHTVTTKDRYGLVTVAGEEYRIADIGLRMLAPRELFRAQGFPDDYIIGDTPAQGLTLTKSAQVRMCGNSVCPPLAAALVTANLAELAVERRVAA
jgi:DNA (cytosine-5)-methyltransferase 1